jgi:hypothetical protein
MNRGGGGRGVGARTDTVSRGPAERGGGDGSSLSAERGGGEGSGLLTNLPDGSRGGRLLPKPDIEVVA